MSFVKPTPIDANILSIASLMELPSQPVSLQRPSGIQGKQIQQIKATAAPPVVNNTFPLQVSRTLVNKAGVYQYRVQFIRPVNSPGYQSTSVLIRTPQGTSRISASASNAPIVFTSQKNAAPASFSIQHLNNDGAVSNPDVGIGKTYPLVPL